MKSESEEPENVSISSNSAYNSVAYVTAFNDIGKTRLLELEAEAEE